MKNLLNLGNALNKAEQKNVFGGLVAIRKCGRRCNTSESCCRWCGGGYYCKWTIPPNG